MKLTTGDLNQFITTPSETRFTHHIEAGRLNSIKDSKLPQTPEHVRCSHHQGLSNQVLG